MELTRTMKLESPAQEPEHKEHFLSLKALLAGILILLAILILLTLWGLVRSLELQNQAASSSQAAEDVASSVEVLEPQNLVPDFLGMEYAHVQNNREYTGIYLFYVTQEYDDTVPAGKIMKQEPEAGTVLKAGETIRLVVSKGPEKVEMPNLFGFTQETAINELETRGLIPSCFMVDNDGSYAAGCVVSTSVEAGEQIEVGMVVTVYIAADPSVQIPVTPEDVLPEQDAEEPEQPEGPGQMEALIEE